MKKKKIIQVEQAIEVTACNLCGKELEDNEATPIKVVVGGSTYFCFHLCEDHWIPLLDRLEKIQSSTGSVKK